MVMAVRIVALLIPLAITLPYLQTNSPPPAAAQQQLTYAQPASPCEWSWETRRMADASFTRVVLESPALDAVRNAPVPRAAPNPARHMSSAKAATTARTSMHPAPRHAKRAPLQPDCQPFVHCAPVVVGKVTPVSPRSM
jgi:hypothetical protein